MNITKLSDTNRTAIYEAVIPFTDIQTRYTTALKKLAETTAVEGFRKGKAPVDIVEKTTSKERIYDQLLQDLIPEIYNKAVEMDKLRPFIQPRIELKRAVENEDWIIQIHIALEPVVKLPDYKKIISDVRGESKKDDIWVPGKDEKADAEAVEKREKFLNAVLQKLIDTTEIELSQLILDEEVNNRLAKLVDDVRKIGLTIDAYLQSRQTTQDQVKEEFVHDILNTYKLEYALNEIGDKENITVDKAELDKLFENMPKDADRKEAEKNAYVYSMMLRKQKIIDFLGGL